MSALDERPLDGAMFARLMAPFEPFESHPCLAVAVSGGRDSLCLALLANEWAAGRGGAVVALIVDHGLRAEAGGEARSTARLLEAHGIEAAVLRWTAAKPRSGLQEAARRARYGLLREACRERGILHLLVAHHANDQAETLVMRAARRSGPDGMAGMAALVESADGRLLRPLLSVRRARLSATLAARDVAWIDDPSNVDPRFERARLRLAGGAGTGPGSGPGVRGAGNARSDQEGRVAEAGVALFESDDRGGIAVDHGGFDRLPIEVRRRLLSRLVQGLGGSDHPPRRARLDRAAGRMSGRPERGKSGRSADFTLSGCRFVLRQAPSGGRERWIVRPESGRKGRQPLIPAAFFACDPAAATHL